MKLIIFLSLLVTGSQAVKAQDQGGMGSGGGYVYCGEFQDTVGRIASTLVTVGQDVVDRTNRVIRVDELWAIKRVLTCLPVSELDRQARSNPATKHTDLLVQPFNGLTPWQNLSRSEQMRLAAHELAVLAGYENDGEYFISESMFAILKANSREFKLIDVTADQVLGNADGSVTLLRPYVVGPDHAKYYVANEFNQESRYAITSSTYESVCKFFFGYVYIASGAATEAKYGNGQKFAEIAGSSLRGLWQIHDQPGNFLKYFESVTCKFR